MSGERHASELNEQRLTEVDLELKATLSIRPSADFEARVLRRIEETTAAPRGWMPRYLVLAAAAAVIIASAVALLMKRPSVESQFQAPTVAATPSPTPDRKPGSETASSSGALVPEVIAEGAGSRRILPRISDQAGTRTDVRIALEPEVIVPREHAEAVRRLVRGIAEERFTVPAAADPTVPQAPEVFLVKPLIVDPIPIPAVDGPGAPTPVVRGLQ
jgi:hypothetical protein